MPNPNYVLSKVHAVETSRTKKEMFTLWNLDLSVIKSCADLKAMIKRRLSSDITAGDCDIDVGYVQDSNVVRVSTTDDLDEVWTLQETNKKMWQYGAMNWRETQTRQAAPSGRKSKKQIEATEVASKKPVDTLERVQILVDELKDKHTTKYTPMQYRIWG